MESLGVVIGGVTVAVVDVVAGSVVGIVIDERINREVSECRMRFLAIREAVAVSRTAPRLWYTTVARRFA